MSIGLFKYISTGSLMMLVSASVGIAQSLSNPQIIDQNFNKQFVFRTGLHFPLGLQPFVSGELKLFKKTTLHLQTGASYLSGYARWDVTDPQELADSDKIGFSAFVAPELRYYYYIPKSKSGTRTLKNFSGYYAAFRYFASTPASIRNSAARYSYENTSAWQINLGWQAQIRKHFFMGSHVGFVLAKNSIQKNKPANYPLFQFNCSIGWAF
jgi:hypothetical protein